MEYTRSSHSVYHCRYHLILATKYRRCIFESGTFAFFKECLENVCKRYPQIQVLELNHDKDHVHIFISIPPSMSVGSVVRTIKCNTGRLMRRKFAFLKEVYWGSDGIWSDGYFVTTAGIDEDTIKRYIQHQGQEDSGQAKLELK